MPDRRTARVHWSQPEQRTRAHLTSLEQAQWIAALCEEKQASDVAILDLRTVCDYTDFFVLATGRNPRLTKAIHDDVQHALKRERQVLARSVSGLPEATWIVGDYQDVVLHVFTPETRSFYRLEDLWSDVPKLQAAAW
jgi:ribosome-associated protein